ncbi:hypothetical protein, partial [Helicobacter sp. 12S02232-10]|uniref:hypothetical protein n=1 Tax=Helicobacter sp. 12S02232-10 TaxID=1476197 RepID=UPI001179A211
MSGTIKDVDGVSDKKEIDWTGVFSNPARKLTINADKEIVIIKPELKMWNGSTATFNFKDSVYSGNFTLGSTKPSEIGGFNNYTSTFTFDGSYQGNSDASLKGYAWVGDIHNYGQINNYTFKNDANFKGNVSQGLWRDGVGHSTFTFTNSSMEGDISDYAYTSINGYTDGVREEYQTFSFSGNSSKGFALKGKDGKNSQIKIDQGTANLILDNGAKAYADLSTDLNGVSPYALPIINITAKNKSYLEGSIKTIYEQYDKYNETIQGTFDSQSTFKGNANNIYGNLKLDFTNSSKMLGTVTNMQNDNDSVVNTILNFKDSSLTATDNTNAIQSLHAALMPDKPVLTATFDGNNTTDGYALKGNVLNEVSTVNLTFKNGAIWQGDYNDGFKKANGEYIITSAGTFATLAFDNATMKGDINGNVSKITLNATNGSQLENININGSATLSATLTDSNVGNVVSIGENGTNSTLTFATASDTAPTDKTGEVSSEDKKITIGDITNFRGTITGTIANAASVGNITLQKSGSDLKIKNADKVGHINVTGGASFTLDNTDPLTQTKLESLNVSGNGSKAEVDLNNSALTTQQIQIQENTTGTMKFSNHSKFIGKISNTGTLNATADQSFLFGGIQTTKGTTNIAFSSTPSSINFDNTKLQNLITTLTPKKDETSQ